MKLIYPKTILLLIFLGLGAISCNDDLSIKGKENDLVSVRDGFLDFRDKTAYEQITQQLKGKTTEQLDAWEKTLSGFVSIRSVYNKALQEEEIFFENGGNSQSHSAYVLENIESLVFESEDNLRPNLPHYEDMLPALVNKLGIMKIGSSIYEYRNKSIKEIRDGDLSKIGLLDDFSESNKERNISVINIVKKDVSSIMGKGLKTAFSGNSNCDGYTSGGGQRVKGNIAIYNYVMVDVWGNTPFPGQTVYQTLVAVGATNQIKRLGVWGNKDTAQLQIVGNVNINPYGTVTINLNSGGSQTSSIGATLYNSGWVNTGWNTVLSINGALTFYGRDNSTCTI